jgi:flagellar hook assembly protein FlgD
MFFEASHGLFKRVLRPFSNCHVAYKEAKLPFRIQVYTVSGRLVAVVPFAVASADVVVPWDGRDREGDRIANGVYLYRVQVEGAAGQARSDMQRLVVMR